MPIINENDTVSVAEIRFGDNDHLAAMVTNLLQAPLLVLLTNVEGLYANDPATHPAGAVLTTVPEIDDTVLDMAGASKSALGTGGMRSKIRAARLATAAGESVIIANGGHPGISGCHLCLRAGRHACFCRTAAPCRRGNAGSVTRLSPRAACCSTPARLTPCGPRAGAYWPSASCSVAGDFGKGDVVALCDADGVEFARGLSNYSAADAGRILGLRTEQIGEVLGAVPYEEVVHRDNLVVIG